MPPPIQQIEDDGPTGAIVDYEHRQQIRSAVATEMGKAKDEDDADMAMFYQMNDDLNPNNNHHTDGIDVDINQDDI